MSRLVTTLVAVVLGFGLWAPSAGAQPGNSGPGAGNPGPGPNAVIRRERVKKRIRALRAYTLTEELSLDELTAGKLFPLLAKFDDDFDRLLQARADIQRRLGGATDPRTDRAIDRLIDEAVANQRAFWDVEDKRLAELRKVLTPVQIARLLIVLPAIERKIQNQLQKAIGGGGPNGGAGGPNKMRDKNPFADDDDADDAPKPPARRPGGPTKPGGPNRPGGPNKPCDPFDSAVNCRN